MTFQTGVTEFAEFVGSEIRRIEKKIPTDGGSQSSDSMIITGNGRPDKPETTMYIIPSSDGFDTYVNKVKGNEPNGTFYSSTNGAGVGAYLWQKQNGKWNVVSADTGVRRITDGAVNIKQGYVSLRRVNNTVECAFTGGAWGAIYFYGSDNKKFTRKNHSKRMDVLQNSKIPYGFRSTNSIMLPFYSDDGEHVGMVYVGGVSNYNYIELRFKDKLPTADMDIIRAPVISWITDEPFPERLP
nr:MAG TPA: hypothetical protein [Caudoviricetes sp.]